MTARARLPLPAADYDALVDPARLDSDALARTGVSLDEARAVYDVLLEVAHLSIVCEGESPVLLAWNALVNCMFTREESRDEAAETTCGPEAARGHTRRLDGQLRCAAVALVTLCAHGVDWMVGKVAEAK